MHSLGGPLQEQKYKNINDYYKWMAMQVTLCNKEELFHELTIHQAIILMQLL